MTIHTETALRNFEFWSGAKDRAEALTWDELDTIERELEELYPEGMTDTELNDLFWFDFDFVVQLLGYEDEEDFDRKRAGEDDEAEEDESAEA